MATLRIYPNGVGGLGEVFVPSSGTSNYECIDDGDINDGDGTFLTGGAAKSERWAMQNPSLPPGARINSVTITVTARGTAGLSCTFTIDAYDGTASTSGSTESVGTTYTNKTRTLNAKPSGGAWDASALNAFEPGITIADTSEDARITNVFADIDYTRAGGLALLGVGG